jgi:hypothetical protein
VDGVVGGALAGGGLHLAKSKIKVIQQAVLL